MSQPKITYFWLISVLKFQMFFSTTLDFPTFSQKSNILPWQMNSTFIQENHVHDTHLAFQTIIFLQYLNSQFLSSAPPERQPQ